MRDRRGHSCRTLSKEAVLLLDGELDAKREAPLREHIAGCAACRAEFESLQAFRSEWKDTPGLPSRAEDRERIRERRMAEAALPGSAGGAAPGRGRRSLAAGRHVWNPFPVHWADAVTAASAVASVVLITMMARDRLADQAVAGPSSMDVLTLVELAARIEGIPLPEEGRALNELDEPEDKDTRILPREREI
jgi:anti-sigma factor RsiW